MKRFLPMVYANNCGLTVIASSVGREAGRGSMRPLPKAMEQGPVHMSVAPVPGPKTLFP